MRATLFVLCTCLGIHQLCKQAEYEELPGRQLYAEREEQGILPTFVRVCMQVLYARIQYVYAYSHTVSRIVSATTNVDVMLATSKNMIHSNVRAHRRQNLQTDTPSEVMRPVCYIYVAMRFA